MNGMNQAFPGMKLSQKETNSMSYNRATIDVKTGKVVYTPMTAEEIAELEAIDPVIIDPEQ